MTSRNENCSSSDSDERSVLTPETGSLPAPCNDLSITPGTPELKWYVVQSKPREEERALHFLKEKGFHTYLPRMEVVKVRDFKNVKTKKPLFPGYLFCRFDKDENLGHVRWTQGVKKLLPESVSPMFVDDEIVQAIQRLEQEDGVIRQQPLQKNDQVRIARGPLKDLLGVFDHWSSDQGRIRVLLNFINYQASVELHHSLVEKVA
jgi:transcriptional antiterminator RfaH